MNGPRLSIDEILDQALRQTPADRDAFLDSACGGDAVLRARLERLIAATGQADSFLESPAVAIREAPSASQTSDQPSDHVGTQIGPYKPLDQIGEGGMGVVYL